MSTGSAMTNPNGSNLAHSLDEPDDVGVAPSHSKFQVGLEMMLGSWFQQGGQSASSAAVSESESMAGPSEVTRTPSFFAEPPSGPAEVVSLIVPEQESTSAPSPDPAGTAALLEAAGEARLKGDLVEAEQLYNKLVTSDPRNAEAVHGLGLLALEDGDVAKAESLIHASMKLDPLHMLCGHLRS